MSSSANRKLADEKKRKKAFSKTFEKKTPDTIIKVMNNKGEVTATIKNGKYEKNS